MFFFLSIWVCNFISLKFYYRQYLCCCYSRSLPCSRTFVCVLIVDWPTIFGLHLMWPAATFHVLNVDHGAICMVPSDQCYPRAPCEFYCGTWGKGHRKKMNISLFVYNWTRIGMRHEPFAFVCCWWFENMPQWLRAHLACGWHVIGDGNEFMACQIRINVEKNCFKTLKTKQVHLWMW